MSRVITFYSYKGGVGRSMALVNVATLLSKWGKKVLMMDWDLEAPGLENFFKEELKSVDWSQQKGVIEWLNAQQNGEAVKWQDWVIPFKTTISETDLHLFVSGGANGHYSEMLRDFNISKFYEAHDGGRRLEQFREELLAAYDFVLIDSRTGVTDFGGICTIQMPDILVMPFSPTEQGLNGTEKIARKVLEAHHKMPLDRFKLLIFPVPSRFDSTPEFETSRRWLHRIAEQLKFLYDDWLPADVSLNDFLQRVKIPYIPYFSFGERLPVIEQGMSDSAGLGYAYESLAMLIARQVDEVDEFMASREIYLQKAILSDLLSSEAMEQFIKELKEGKYKEAIVSVATEEAKDDGGGVQGSRASLYTAAGLMVGTQLGRVFVGATLGSTAAAAVSIAMPIAGIGTAIWALLGEKDKAEITRIYSEAVKEAKE